MAIAKLGVEGMTCMACVGRVERALRGVDGVVKVSVRLDEKCAEVQFDSQKVGADGLEEAVKAAGYAVSSVG